MLNPLKNVMTVEMVRCLIAKIKGALETKVSMGDVVSSWQSTPDDAHVPTEKLVKDTLDNLPPGTAVKGDAESEYRTGNVNLTPANIGAYSKTESDSRYKAVQNPVIDPTASGSGLSFIDSVTQDANGVVTPHKKTVQDGTTTQKGVVQLNNAINSTSTTEAATPKAVKDAYDELNNKIVARAVFLSQQEWAAQSLLPGDPAKVYYVEDGTGEDAYTVYVWKESISEYVEVDESSIDLDGYWHDGPSTTGNGNVVTGITLGNDGVPVIEKGITALTQHQDISGKLNKADVGVANGAASLDSNGDVPLEQIPDSVKDKIVYIDGVATLNTSTGVFALTVPNTTFATISTVVNEGKLPVLRVTVNNGKSYLKLYYKGLMSDNSDNHWHSFGSTDNQVNSPCTTDAKVFDNDEWRMIENLALNSKGNGNDVTVTPDGTSSGTDIGNSTTLKEWAQKFKNLVGSLKALAFKDTVGTSDIADDAITAAKVKGNETLPVNVSGTAGMADKLRYQDNVINFANVPTTGNKHRSWFNYHDGDTNQANPSNPIKSYWFGDRNRKPDNTKLVTGGITNKTFIGSSSSVTWNSNVGTGYGCCCIKFTYDLTTGKNRTVAIRLLIDCDAPNGDMCYVDLMLKVQPYDWNSFAIATGRFDTSTNFNLGRIYYRIASGAYYFAVETGAISSKVTPIIIGSDDESDSDYSTLNVEFGDFNVQLTSSDWIQQATKRVVYKDIGGTSIGSPTTPIYVDSDGSVKACGFQINFGTPIAGTNVLNIVK